MPIRLARRLGVAVLMIFFLSGSDCGSSKPKDESLPASSYQYTGNPNGGPSAAPSSMSGNALTLANLIMGYRQQAGMTPVLTGNDILTGVAQWQAEDMASNSYVGLVGSDDEDVFTRLANSGYANAWAGVIAEGYDTDPQEIFNAMVSNASADATLLNNGSRGYNSIGVGYSNGYWMVILGGAASSSTGAAPTTTTVMNATATSSPINQPVTFTANVTSPAGTVTGGTVTFTVFDASNNPIGSSVTSGPVTPSVAISTFVSSGLNTPAGLAFDTAGNLYVANRNNGTISKVTPGGAVSIFAGSGLNAPFGLAFDTAGNLYAANDLANSITMVTPGGAISTFVSAGLNQPEGLAFDTAGNLYVANNGNSTISKVTPGGAVSTFVSSGLSNISGLAMDTAGNLYVANDGNNTISKVTPGGTVSTFASGLNGPRGLAIDSAGNLYVANYTSNTISMVTPGGAVSTFVSSGLNAPWGLAFDTAGNLYVANWNGGTITKVSSGNGTASAVWTLPAGTPIGTYTIKADYSGDASFQPSIGTGTLTVN